MVAVKNFPGKGKVTGRQSDASLLSTIGMCWWVIPDKINTPWCVFLGKSLRAASTLLPRDKCLTSGQDSGLRRPDMVTVKMFSGKFHHSLASPSIKCSISLKKLRKILQVKQTFCNLKETIFFLTRVNNGSDSIFSLKDWIWKMRKLYNVTIVILFFHFDNESGSLMWMTHIKSCWRSFWNFVLAYGLNPTHKKDVSKINCASVTCVDLNKKVC